jgi:hypothetical protein
VARKFPLALELLTSGALRLTALRLLEKVLTEANHRHLHAHALGGPMTVDNLALRCRAHNAYEAEQCFGPWRGKRAVREKPPPLRIPCPRPRPGPPVPERLGRRAVRRGHPRKAGAASGTPVPERHPPSVREAGAPVRTRAPREGHRPTS